MINYFKGIEIFCIPQFKIGECAVDTHKFTIGLENNVNLHDVNLIHKRVNLPHYLQTITPRAPIASVNPMHAKSEIKQVDQHHPTFGYHDSIMEAIRKNQVVLICGETGCGKSTQIPQYIMNDCTVRKQNCQIFCTQTRRMVVIALATRVSEERQDVLGHSVGYQIRFDSRISSSTKLTFTTR